MGEKELFQGTWLNDNWAFEPQPVIRLNMSELVTRDVKRNVSRYKIEELTI